MCFANTAHGDINLHRCTVLGESLPLRYVHNSFVHISAGDAINCGTVVRTDCIASGVDGHCSVRAAVQVPVRRSGHDGKHTFRQPWKALRHLALNSDENLLWQIVQCHCLLYTSDAADE